jgi:myo-inositol 2-dehydrogenase/D-chiro-inositol 1-dehydrogenase
MNHRKIRFGVLGAGRIGKIHCENIANRIPGAELIAVSDVVSSSAAALAARYSGAKTFANYKDVLAHPEVDAVAICTPTNTHYQIILDAAAAGKHIFCEKPIDLALDKIEAVQQAVEKSGIHFIVAFNRRFDPNFKKVHDMVRSGKIGQPHVLRITSRDPAPPPEEYIRSSGGLFLDMTIHDFDMARYLMGREVVEVYARAKVLVDPVFERNGDFDTAVVTLTFDNGAMGTIDNSRKAVYGYDQRVEVFGSEGMVAVSNNTPDTHLYFDSTGTHAALPLNFFMERYTESYLREMQAFVDAVDKKLPAPVGVKDGLMAVAIGLAAAKSVRENRPVPVAEILQRSPSWQSA